MKNSSVIKFSIGLFFLIPTAHAQTDQSNGYLGITVENVSPQIAQMMDKSPDTASSDGAFIFSVATNGPAFKAGLKPGDVITQVNGMPIKNEYDGEADISNIESGQSASISYIREGSIHQVSVVLGSRPNILPNYILAKGDNIWAITQLTSSGTDSNPVLSLDHKTVYFIRTFGPGSGDVSFGPDTQIWSVFTTNGVARPLLKPILSNDPKQNLSGFSNLVCMHPAWAAGL